MSRIKNEEDADELIIPDDVGEGQEEQDAFEEEHISCPNLLFSLAFIYNSISLSCLTKFKRDNGSVESASKFSTEACQEETFD